MVNALYKQGQALWLGFGALERCGYCGSAEDF